MKRTAERIGVRAGIIYVALLVIMSATILGLRGTPFYSIIALLSNPFASIVGLSDYPKQAEVAFRILLSLIIGGAWWAIDHGRRDEGELQEIFFAELRFVLAAALISSGLGKLLAVDTPIPSQADWIRPMREMHPQHYLTVWMGSSVLHKTSLGLVDVTAGILLLFRRTKLLGAFMALGAIGNFVVTQIAFDDPRVGTYWAPAELAGMAAVLVLSDFKRFFVGFFNPTETVPPARPSHKWHSPVLGKLARFAFPVALAIIAIANIPTVVKGYDGRHYSPIAGVYRVEQYSINGQSTLSEQDAPSRWRVVAIDDCARFAVRTVDDKHFEGAIKLENSSSLERHRACEAATSAQDFTLAVVPPNPMPASFVRPGLSGTLTFKHTAPDVLEVDAKLDGNNVNAHLRRLPPDAFPVFVWLLDHL